ncbi:MAG: hypothetical protein QF578_18015 [Alphaproteobacteria bacterium]|jgi:MYXO-CTERM domain-containing protein|nr:hypothetical protein [Alphaproteobacteria bacterium]MDP6814716.1 hypothetical protein [Alphaproteobacteria bacterium]
MSANPAMTSHRSDRQPGLRARLALGTALASLALGGYGHRPAYAGACTGGSGVYSCSGPAGAFETTQLLFGAPLTVTTTAGFGINTAIAPYPGYDINGLTLYGTGGLSFTDGHNSSITGVHSGIWGENRNSGNLTITSTSQATGSGNYGILANNRHSGTQNLEITADAATGGDSGIRALNSGSGSWTVTTNGQVTGINNSGIRGRNSGTDLIVDANAGVTGQIAGIQVSNSGTGHLKIDAAGAVTGTTGTGIIAQNNGSFPSTKGTYVEVTTHAAVSGGDTGIYAGNYGGTGHLTVTTNDTVTGTTDFGIYASNGFGGDGLTVTTQAAVSGGSDGIHARNRGKGALTVTANGTVSGTASYYFARGDGIFADNSNASADLTITTLAAVSGGNDGIYARNLGTGVLTVTANANVTGGSGSGIDTRTSSGMSTVITLNSGAMVSSTTGSAIFNNTGDSTTTVNAGAGVTGAISLGGGSDALTFDGGSFAGVTFFDGGDGAVDTLTFTNVTGTVTGADIANFESVAIGAGASIGFSDNTLTTETLSVTDGGKLELEDGVGANFLLNGDLAIAAGGSLATEIISASDYDTVQVVGNVNFGIGGLIDFVMDDVDPLEYGLFDGLSLTFLTADSILGFTNLAFNFIGLDSLYTASVSQAGGTSLSVNFNLASSAQVPAPSPIGIFATGLLGLFGLGWARRRRAAPE